MKKFVDHKRERGEFHKSSTLQGVNDVAAWAPFGVRPPHFHGLEMKKQFFGLEIHKNKYVPAITFFLLIVMKIEPLEPDLKPNKQQYQAARENLCADDPA